MSKPKTLRLSLGAEEFLTELSTDQAIDDVTKVEDKDPEAKAALANIQETEDEAVAIKDEAEEDDTSTEENPDDPANAEQGATTDVTGNEPPDTDAASPDAAQDSDAAAQGAEVKDDGKDKKDEAAEQPAAESIFLRW